MSSLVDSVQNIEHTFPSTDTQTYTTLTSGTDIVNCVPFVSWYGDTDYPAAQFFDVWFEDLGDDPRIYFQRSETRSTDLYIKVAIVEFDPTKVKVYQGELPTSIPYNTETSVTISGTYQAENTALVFYHRSSSASQNPQCHMYRGKTADATGAQTTVSFLNKYNAVISTYGHYFLFESIDNDFTVSHYTGTTAGGGVWVGHAFDWHNSFLLMSHCPDYPDPPTQYIGLRAYLYGNSRIELNRASTGGGNSNYNVQLIEFTNEATASGVWYSPKIVEYYSMGSTTTEREITLDMPFVSSTATIIPTQKLSRTSGDVVGHISGSFSAVWLTNSGTGFHIQRATSEVDHNPTYSFVDWAGIPPSYPNLGTNPAPIASGISPVKSIESINHTLYEFVDAITLTKGQDVSNCVVFKSGYCTQTSSYDQQFRHESMAYFRGNELIVERGNEGWQYEMFLSVVEFYPEQVRVQQGQFVIGQDQTTVSITIDEVDKTKTFLVFGHFFGGSEQPWQYHSTRGQIVDSTTLTFTRSIAHGYAIMGSYFVVEDLTDVWEVTHIDTSRSSSSPYAAAYNDIWTEYNTFTLFSSENESASTGPQYALWRTYWHSQHTPAVFDGKTTNYYGKISAMVVKFLDETKIHTHFSAENLTGTTKTKTYSLHSEWLGKENCVTPIPSCNNGTSRVDSTTGVANTDAYWKIAYDVDTNQVTTQRNTSQTSQYSTYHTIFSVCWQGAERTIEDKSYTSLGSFVKTIEHLKYEGTDRRVTFTPSKGQSLRNCFPIATWKCGESSADMERYFKSIWFLLDLAYVKFESFNATDEYGGMLVDIALIEFDPAQIRVQHGQTNIMAGSATATTTISGVDTSKAFITSYTFCHSDVSNVPGPCRVATKFNSSTQLGFSRGKTEGSLVISWFIVECLQDQWEVDHYSLLSRSNAAYVYLNMDPIVHKSLMLPAASVSDNCSSTGPGYWTTRTYADIDSFGNAYRMVFNKEYTNYYMEGAEVSIIKFNENSGVRIIPQHFSFSGATDSVDVTLPEEVDVNRSVIWNALTTNTMRVQSTSSTYVQEAFPFGAFVDGNTANFSKSSYTASVSAWGHVYIVEWPMPTHELGITVSEGTSFIPRDVRLHKTDTGEVLANLTTSGTETLVNPMFFYTSYSGSLYAVCFDDEALPGYNGLIYTDVIPALVSGTFPYKEGWVS